MNRSPLGALLQPPFRLSVNFSPLKLSLICEVIIFRTILRGVRAGRLSLRTKQSIIVSKAIDKPVMGLTFFSVFFLGINWMGVNRKKMLDGVAEDELTCCVTLVSSSFLNALTPKRLTIKVVDIKSSKTQGSFGSSPQSVRFPVSS